MRAFASLTGGVGTSNLTNTATSRATRIAAARPRAQHRQIRESRRYIATRTTESQSPEVRPLRHDFFSSKQSASSSSSSSSPTVPSLLPFNAARSSHGRLQFSPSQAVHEGWYSHQNDPNNQPSSSSHRVSDAEYEVRLGRAVSLLRATLEDFMRIGLVDYDSSNVTGSSSNSGLGLPGIDRLGIGAILEALGASGRKKEAQSSVLPPHLRNAQEQSPVYHPHIVFKFRPPAINTNTDAQGNTAPTGPSADDPLITFSGRTLYFASAHVLRHALFALFSETKVSIENIKLHRENESSSSSQESSSQRRTATLVARLTFSGAVRVTHQVHDYTVIFRYRFDEDSGQIIEHKVERIEPAPGKKIWMGLSHAFARLAGLQPQSQAGQPSGCQHIRGEEKPTTARRGQPVPVPLPIISDSASARSRRGNKTDKEAYLDAVRWQRRRSYTTQSNPVKRSSEATDATTAPITSTAFFSHPRGAQDMPGPSLLSLLIPSAAERASGVAHKSSTQDATSNWAPASNDPNVVSHSAADSASASKASQDLTLYRPVQSALSSRQALMRVVTGLSKSNLTVLVTLTGMAGYALCPSELVALSSSATVLGSVGTLLAFAFGTAACSASANAINQLREIPYDAQMARTRNRLLPSRTITPLAAATFATVAGTSGIATLSILNPLTAFLGGLNIWLYAFVYTPMKRRHIANTWVGAIVGALPPLMGWSACTSTLTSMTDLPAWCLAALLFAWQFPHFNSLSHNLSSEYARGGYRMMSVTNPSLNRRTSLRYAISLLPICSLALPLSGAVSPLAYSILSLPPNLILVQAAYRFWKEGTEKSARWCFWVSLVHLPAVMVLAMMTKKSIVDAVYEWINGQQQEESGGKEIQDGKQQS
ncbi:unnamed protein product [Sympodiomycopsis kandeliae]